MALMEESGGWRRTEVATTISAQRRTGKRRLYLEYWNHISIALIVLRLGMGLYGVRYPFEVATLILVFWLIGHLWLRAALRPPPN
jgi:hypothetical protein